MDDVRLSALIAPSYFALWRAARESRYDELVAAKVRRIWDMGGIYTTGAEFNFGNVDVYRTASAYVCANCPVPIVFLDYYAGLSIVVGDTLSEMISAADDPLYEAMVNYGSGSGRYAWDPLTTLMACLNHPETAGYSLVAGTNAVNAETGVNTFTADPEGPHAYIVKTRPDAWYKDYINRILERSHAKEWSVALFDQDTGSALHPDDVVNNLSTADDDAPLSASMGKRLNEAKITKYTDITQLGLSAGCTMRELLGALPDNAEFEGDVTTALVTDAYASGVLYAVKSTGPTTPHKSIIELHIATQGDTGPIGTIVYGFLPYAGGSVVWYYPNDVMVVLTGASAPALGTVSRGTLYRCNHTAPTAAPTMTIPVIYPTSSLFSFSVTYKAKASSPAAPVITNNSAYTVKYSGTDVSGGVFTPVANTVYTMEFLFNGINIHCGIAGTL